MQQKQLPMDLPRMLSERSEKMVFKISHGFTLSLLIKQVNINSVFTENATSMALINKPCPSSYVFYCFYSIRRNQEYLDPFLSLSVHILEPDVRISRPTNAFQLIQFRRLVFFISSSVESCLFSWDLRKAFCLKSTCSSSYFGGLIFRRTCTMRMETQQKYMLGQRTLGEREKHPGRSEKQKELTAGGSIQRKKSQGGVRK